MAAIRHHALIDATPDQVWQVVSDAGAISTWFPLIEESSASQGVRHCTMKGGGKLVEVVVTSDDELRRFQYRITAGDMPLDSHLGTIDVLDVDGQALVVYSTDVTPDEAAEQMDRALADGSRASRTERLRCFAAEVPDRPPCHNSSNNPPPQTHEF